MPQTNGSREMKRRISKNDLIFIAVLSAVVVVICLFAWQFKGADGARVVVTVDGEVYGTYSLSENQEIPIVIDGRTSNVLVIEDGAADMIEADCPDKLCVHQRAISKDNETIVCLPNKVVVEVMGSEETGLDSVAR